MDREFNLESVNISNDSISHILTSSITQYNPAQILKVDPGRERDILQSE